MLKIKTIKNLQVIGHSDRIDFTEIGLENVACKIDTGADTSSVDCHKIRIREKDGKEVLVFRLLHPKNPNYLEKDMTVENFTEKVIRNSFGNEENRYFVKLKVMLMGEEFESEFSLANRSGMTFPVLLGKKLLKKRFIVDVSKKNVSFNLKENLQ